MMDYKRILILLGISALLYGILLIALIWFYRDSIGIFFLDRPILKIFSIALALSVTWILWAKLKHLTELRSWLVLKVIGNLVFIFSVGSAWLLDLSAEIMFLIMFFAFIFWTWGLVVLVGVVKNRNANSITQGGAV